MVSFCFLKVLIIGKHYTYRSQEQGWPSERQLPHSSLTLDRSFCRTHWPQTTLSLLRPGSWQFPLQSTDWLLSCGVIESGFWLNVGDSDNLHMPHWSNVYVWDGIGIVSDMSDTGWTHRPLQSLLEGCSILVMSSSTNQQFNLSQKTKTTATYQIWHKAQCIHQYKRIRHRIPHSQ